MKAILRGNRDTFAECLTEKLMIYALGRGLEGYDRRAVEKIANDLAANDYRFSTLISGIVRQRALPNGQRRRSEIRWRKQRREYEMILTRKHVSRRTLLRGVGAAIALPVLDAMVPALTAATTVAQKSLPTRMVFVYVPNGIDMRNWTPAADGRSFAFPKILELAAPAAGRCAGPQRPDGSRRHGAGRRPGDHARASASFLTGVHPKKTAGSDISVGISVDQFAAQKIGSATAWPRSNSAAKTVTWPATAIPVTPAPMSTAFPGATPTVPNPPEINPRAVFERLFGSDEDAGDPAARARNARLSRAFSTWSPMIPGGLQGGSGHDRQAQARRIFDRHSRSGAPGRDDGKTDRDKLSCHSDHGEARWHSARICRPCPAYVRSADHRAADGYHAHFTFMLAREGSNRSYREIGVPEGHHGLSHHRNDPALMDKVAAINRHHMDQFAYFLTKLKADARRAMARFSISTMVLYGSGISDGNRHNHDDLAGVARRRFAECSRPGRHVRYATGRPCHEPVSQHAGCRGNSNRAFRRQPGSAAVS